MNEIYSIFRIDALDFAEQDEVATEPDDGNDGDVDQNRLEIVDRE